MSRILIYRLCSTIFSTSLFLKSIFEIVERLKEYNLGCNGDAKVILCGCYATLIVSNAEVYTGELLRGSGLYIVPSKLYNAIHCKYIDIEK